MVLMEVLLDTEKIPERLNIPWLNNDYIKKYGWVPGRNNEIKESYELCLRLGIPCRELSEIMGFEDTAWGVLPVKDIRIVKQGEVIVFYEYDEWEENGKYDSDRFKVIDENYIREIKNDRLGAPFGIIVPCPES